MLLRGHSCLGRLDPPPERSAWCEIYSPRRREGLPAAHRKRAALVPSAALRRDAFATLELAELSHAVSARHLGRYATVRAQGGLRRASSDTRSLPRSSIRKQLCEINDVPDSFELPFTRRKTMKRQTVSPVEFFFFSRTFSAAFMVTLALDFSKCSFAGGDVYKLCRRLLGCA